HLFLTHAHTDHGGGTAHLADRLNLTVYASASTAKIVSSGDEAAVSLPPAKAAGSYPMDFVYRPCPVNRILSAGEVVGIGPLKIELIATPGHSHDHHCYLVTTPHKRYLVGGDAIFFGGKIVLQNTYDCSVPESIASIQRLATISFEALLAGHFNFSLNRGQRHILAACEVIDKMGCPVSII
ncbi:MAG TPA: MBL fold metallo-hydrolase, partial [Anaerolineae bacterium]|nr:MBL fold metallo-hydrolase [Anaerolineae bacterium]